MSTFSMNTHLHKWQMPTSHMKSNKQWYMKNKSCLVLLVTVQYSIIKTPNSQTPETSEGTDKER